MGAYELITLIAVLATLFVNTAAAVAATITLYVMVRPTRGRHAKGRHLKRKRK
ncbi:hypothetical protein [Nocardiopsis tropica]|uniref:Uncharacterized protein n=1 Tax=Nocardiopsis tropica TaxID=109330 RepID=A0ABU7KL93_9ACTN|nr:hypothetical protein [Nocardiopsis umidischolae]MEE2050059.1 hypothetical protein [Nocardiopsis umidischolae]